MCHKNHQRYRGMDHNDQRFCVTDHRNPIRMFRTARDCTVLKAAGFLRNQYACFQLLCPIWSSTNVTRPLTFQYIWRTAICSSQVVALQLLLASPSTVTSLTEYRQESVTLSNQTIIHSYTCCNAIIQTEF